MRNVQIVRPLPRRLSQESSHEHLMQLEHDLTLMTLRSTKSAFQMAGSAFSGRQQPHKQQQISCTCKKSRCLKQYCDCFAYNERCNQSCKCVSCMNNQQNETARIQAYDENAFHNNLRRNKSSVKGCNCKKSYCLKKYCQCYNGNQECSQHCRCEDCKNNQKYIYYERQPDQPAIHKKKKADSAILFNKLDEVINLFPKEEELNILYFLVLTLQ